MSTLWTGTNGLKCMGTGCASVAETVVLDKKDRPRAACTRCAKIGYYPDHSEPLTVEMCSDEFLEMWYHSEKQIRAKARVVIAKEEAKIEQSEARAKMIQSKLQKQGALL